MDECSETDKINARCLVRWDLTARVSLCVCVCVRVTNPTNKIILYREEN